MNRGHPRHSKSTGALAFVSRLGVPEGSSKVVVLDVRSFPQIVRRLGVISKVGRPLSPAARAFVPMLRASREGR